MITSLPDATLEHWFEPSFPLNLILNAGNYFICFLIFLIFYRKKIINLNLFIFISIMLTTPFFFNGFLFEWWYLPDQSKYLYETKAVRENFFSYSGLIIYDAIQLIKDLDFVPLTGLFKVKLTGIFYGISPLVNFETFNSIGFWNRTVYFFTVIFLIKKNYCNDHLKLFFFLSPSLILFSSISLRENLIVISMILFLYFFYKKNLTASVLLYLIIGLIKIQNLMILNLFIFIDYFYIKKEIRLIFLICFIIILVGILYIYQENILEQLNIIRLGFFTEEYGNYQSLSAPSVYKENYTIQFNLISLKILLFAMINFILSPASKDMNLFSSIILIENLILMTYLFYRFKNDFNKNKKIVISWTLIFFSVSFLYGAVIFNDGQIHRYKTPIICFIIFGYINQIKNYKKLKKLNKY